MACWESVEVFRLSAKYDFWRFCYDFQSKFINTGSLSFVTGSLKLIQWVLWKYAIIISNCFDHCFLCFWIMVSETTAASFGLNVVPGFCVNSVLRPNTTECFSLSVDKLLMFWKFIMKKYSEADYLNVFTLCLIGRWCVSYAVLQFSV